MFLLVPFYTRVLSPEDYGNGDMIVTIISFLIPIFSLCVSEGALRFSIGKNNKSIIFMYSIKTIFIGFLILILLGPIFYSINLIRPYLLDFYLLYLFTILNQFFNQFLRGLNKIKLIGIVGVVATIVNLLSNIVLLVIFNTGIRGYLTAYVLTSLISSVLLFIFGRLYKFIEKTPKTHPLKGEMLKFNIPLIPNKVSWWTISTFSRYVLRYFYGANLLGIYTAANKVPTVVSTVYGVVQQSLLLSVLDEYEETKSYSFFSKAYNIMDSLLLVIVVILNMIIKFIALFLFGDEFFNAYLITPMLIVSIFFGSLHGNITTVFSAKKKTKTLFSNSFLGMGTTLLLSLVLVPRFGMGGAGFSTLFSYFIVWIHLFIKSGEFIDWGIHKLSKIAMYSLIVAQSILILLIPYSYYLIYSLFALTVIMGIRHKDLKSILKISFKSIKRVFKKA